MTTTAQLGFELDAPPYDARDLDLVAATFEDRRRAIALEAFRAQRAPMPCRCPRPLHEGLTHCVRCGRDITTKQKGRPQ